MYMELRGRMLKKSSLARGKWIEAFKISGRNEVFFVFPCKRGVD